MGAVSVSRSLLAKQSDGRLLELLAEGHGRAFETIVLRYRAELLSYCERLGLSDARAEDALQHALLKAWLALQAGSEVRELRAWLYRIVHNTAVNVVRRSSEERALDLDAALIEAVAAAPDAELERASAAREALAHVAALPQMQRHAILLSALEGRTHEQVASALGISDVAVRGLIYRARVTLRAAAAAFAPAPLIAWCTQAASRLGARAGTAQLTLGGGPPGAGGVLLKGTALVATAALAAGAVLGPLRGHRAQSAQAHALSPGKTPAGSSRAPARDAPARSVLLVPARGSSIAKVSLPSAPPRSARVHSGSAVLLTRRVRPLIAPHHAGAGSGTSAPLPSQPAPAPATAGTPTKAVLVEAASNPPAHAGTNEAGGSNPSPIGSSGGGGSSGPVSGGAPEAPKVTGPPRSEHEEEEAQEKAESEREAAKERADQEAEAAREKSEREAARGGD